MADVIRSEWLLVLLAVLAVARLTHLVTTDYILDRPRAWIGAHAPTSIAYLITCPWCLSIWLGGGVAVATYEWHTHWYVQIPLLGLAASYVTGYFEQVSGLVNAEHERADAETEAT